MWTSRTSWPLIWHAWSPNQNCSWIARSCSLRLWKKQHWHIEDVASWTTLFKKKSYWSFASKVKWLSLALVQSGCHNCYYNDKGLSAGNHFFSFPTDPKTRNRWCNLTKWQHGKDDFNVTAATVVCSEHFRQGDIIRKLSGHWDSKKGMWSAKTDTKTSWQIFHNSCIMQNVYLFLCT